MTSWRRKVLLRVRELGKQGKVRFTLKALREAARVGFGFDDVLEVLADVAATDLVGRLVSASTSEWLYVFKPRLPGGVLYLKIALRSDCIVISFHEDQEEVEHGQDE